MIRSIISWLISGVFIKLPPIIIHYNYYILQRAPKSKIENIKTTEIKYIEKETKCEFISYKNENPNIMLNQFWNNYQLEKSSWR